MQRVVLSVRGGCTGLVFLQQLLIVFKKSSAYHHCTVTTRTGCHSKQVCNCNKKPSVHIKKHFELYIWRLILLRLVTTIDLCNLDFDGNLSERGIKLGLELWERDLLTALVNKVHIENNDRQNFTSSFMRRGGVGGQ